MTPGRSGTADLCSHVHTRREAVWTLWRAIQRPCRAFVDQRGDEHGENVIDEQGASWGRLDEADHLELERFRVGLLRGHKWPLTRQERRWLRIFREMGRQFSQLTEDESFAVSLEALARCFRMGRPWAMDRYYVRRACRNAHIDYLRAEPKQERMVQLTYKHEAVDRHGVAEVRLDMDAAVRKMDPELATVIRLLGTNHQRKDIAVELKVSPSTASRRIRQAQTQLRASLGHAYRAA